MVKVGRLKLELLGGWLSGELSLPQFKKLIAGRGAKVLVELEPVYEDPDDENCPAELQAIHRRGIEWLLENEAAAAKAVLAAVAKSKQHDVELVSLKFHDVANGKRPYIGYGFSCSDDEEHGFGLLLHGTRVVESGQADTAILEWIAEADAKKTKKRKKTRSR